MKSLMQRAAGLIGGKDQSALIGKSLQIGNYHVQIEKQLGEGGYATIYSVLCRQDNKRYAMKHFRIMGEADRLQSIMKEALLMKRLKPHPNILTLYAASFAGPDEAPTDGFFLMDLCHGNLVETLQTRHKIMTENDILHIILQVSRGLSHMHNLSPPVAHRDLKAENILQSLTGEWLLCDFGSASTTNQVFTTAEEIAVEEDIVSKNTTSAYRPPELYDLYSRQLVNTKVDVWALGVLLYLMCFGKFPFQPEAKLQVLKGSYDMPPSQHSSHTRQLIRAMLSIQAAARPTVDQAIDCISAVLAGRTPPPGSFGGASATASAAPTHAQPEHAAKQPAPRANGAATPAAPEQHPRPPAPTFDPFARSAALAGVSSGAPASHDPFAPVATTSASRTQAPRAPSQHPRVPEIPPYQALRLAPSSARTPLPKPAAPAPALTRQAQPSGNASANIPAIPPYVPPSSRAPAATTSASAAPSQAPPAQFDPFVASESAAGAGAAAPAAADPFGQSAIFPAPSRDAAVHQQAHASAPRRHGSAGAQLPAVEAVGTGQNSAPRDLPDVAAPPTAAAATLRATHGGSGESQPSRESVPAREAAAPRGKAADSGLGMHRQESAASHEGKDDVSSPLRSLMGAGMRSMRRSFKGRAKEGAGLTSAPGEVARSSSISADEEKSTLIGELKAHLLQLTADKDALKQELKDAFVELHAVRSQRDRLEAEVAALKSKCKQAAGPRGQGEGNCPRCALAVADNGHVPDRVMTGRSASGTRPCASSAQPRLPVDGARQPVARAVLESLNRASLPGGKARHRRFSDVGTIDWGGFRTESDDL